MNQSINTDGKNSKEPQQKYRLGTVSIKILGGLNRFYGRPTSPSASIMAQNIQLFGPRGGCIRGFQPGSTQTAVQPQILYSGFQPRSTQTAVQPQKMPRGLNFGFRNKRDWAIYVAKTRALISCAITAHLICTFVFTYAKKEVHSWHSSWTQLDSNRSTYVRHISHRLQRLLVGRSIILYSQRTIKVLIKLSGMICTFSWHIAKTGVSDTDTYIIWYIWYVHYGV